MYTLRERGRERERERGREGGRERERERERDRQDGLVYERGEGLELFEGCIYKNF